jgi:hypothetical protein
MYSVGAAGFASSLLLRSVGPFTEPAYLDAITRAPAATSVPAPARWPVFRRSARLPRRGAGAGISESFPALAAGRKLPGTPVRRRTGLRYGLAETFAGAGIVIGSVVAVMARKSQSPQLGLQSPLRWPEWPEIARFGNFGIYGRALAAPASASVRGFINTGLIMSGGFNPGCGARGPIPGRGQVGFGHLDVRLRGAARPERFCDFTSDRRRAGCSQAASRQCPTHRLATTTTDVTPGTLVTTTMPGGYGRVPSL